MFHRSGGCVPFGVPLKSPGILWGAWQNSHTAVAPETPTSGLVLRSCLLPATRFLKPSPVNCANAGQAVNSIAASSTKFLPVTLNFSPLRAFEYSLCLPHHHFGGRLGPH